MTAWSTVRLCEIAKIDREGIDPRSIPDGSLYVGLEHIESGGRLLNVSGVSNGDLASTKFRFGPNHLLYGKLRPYLSKIALPDFEGVCSTDILPVLPSKRLDRAYLAYFLRQPRMIAYASSRSEGANLPRLSPKALAEFEIPLPPLAEQKRITAILDQADELRRKRRRAIERLRDLTAAIFVEMFGEPGAPVPGVESVPLSRVAELINGDRSSNYPNGDDIVRAGVPFLSVKNINESEVDLSSCNFITEEKFLSLSQGKLRRHDLIITLRGTLGQCAEFDCSYETGFINAQMMIIRAGERLLPKYLRAFIAHPRTQALLKRDSSGSAVPQLTGKQVGELPVTIPSRHAQEVFCRRASGVRSTFVSHVAHSAKLDALFASLQHHAFEGRF